MFFTILVSSGHVLLYSKLSGRWMARLIINVFLYVFSCLFCCEILTYSSFHWCQEREQAIREFLNQPARKISRYVTSSTSLVLYLFCHLPVVSETRSFDPECKDCYPSGVRELKMSKMSEEKEWPGTFWIRHAPFALFPQCNHVYVLQTQVVDGRKTLRERNVFAKERQYQHKV